jgi:hypothetical protein
VQHPLAVGVGHRQGQPGVLGDLEALEAEAEGVRGVLDVVAVPLDQFGPVGHRALAAASEEAVGLAVEVADEALDGALREERGRERAQLRAETGDRVDRFRGGEERQQDRGVPGDGESEELAERVHDQVGVAVPGAVAFGLGPPDVVVHGAAQADRAFGRFDEDAHLVVVVGAGDGDAVEARADLGAQDLAGAGDVGVAVLGVGQIVGGALGHVASLPSRAARSERY